MDKNTLIGLGLILVIFLTFGWLQQPSAEQIKAQQERLEFVQDSILEADNIKRLASQAADTSQLINAPVLTIEEQNSLDSLNLSKSNSKLVKKFDVFAPSATGEKQNFIVENDLLRLTVSNKGGKVIKAELKKYQNYKNYMKAMDSLPDVESKDLPILEPLQLFDEDSSDMYVNINLLNAREIKTNELFFLPVKQEENKLVLRAKTTDAAQFIEVSYELKDNYDVDFSLDFIGLEDVIDGDKMFLNWKMKSLLTEKEPEGQSRMSSVFYKPTDDGRTYLYETSESTEELESKTTWVAFKHCYFSSIVISEKGFQKGGEVYSKPIKTDKYSDEYRAKLNISADIDQRTSVPLTFFFGPNEYDILNAHGNEMVDIIDLGWGIFRWTAKWLIKPIFNFLNGFNWAMGLIILLVTIIVRLIIMPLTYKNYKSSAKMKVLKPEIAEINEKFKDGDAAAKQKETMALYRKTGVNPMAGCLPMFIQMPILLAVFRFFPSSIELRQRSFLWAEDLSTYESIYNFPEGFSIPAYGAHVSLFTLLLCISTIFYTRMNSNQMSMPSQPGMPNMKIIMYMMPLMMLFFLNNYSAGLTFYYLCGNLITMGLMLFIKKYMIDEKKIRATIELNKTKPKKQSAFQKRMEEAMKQQQDQKKNSKKGKK